MLHFLAILAETGDRVEDFSFFFFCVLSNVDETISSLLTSISI